MSSHFLKHTCNNFLKLLNYTADYVLTKHCWFKILEILKIDKFSGQGKNFTYFTYTKRSTNIINHSVVCIIIIHIFSFYDKCYPYLTKCTPRAIRVYYLPV